MPENVRVQLTRGTTAELENYTGKPGEVVIDQDKKALLVLGETVEERFVVGGSDTVKVLVNNFNTGNITADDGVVVTKEYTDSSLRIRHNKGKSPIEWSGINKSTNPNAFIIPSSTVNMQVIDDNTVILTSVSNINVAEYNLIF